MNQSWGRRDSTEKNNTRLGSQHYMDPKHGQVWFSNQAKPSITWVSHSQLTFNMLKMKLVFFFPNPAWPPLSLCLTAFHVPGPVQGKYKSPFFFSDFLAPTFIRPQDLT